MLAGVAGLSTSALAHNHPSNPPPLDTQGNQTFAVRMQVNTYNISNPPAYRYNRLDLTANNGAAGVAVSEPGLGAAGGKVVDVSGGNTADGAAIIRWPYGGADNRQRRMPLTTP